MVPFVIIDMQLNVSNFSAYSIPNRIVAALEIPTSIPSSFASLLTISKAFSYSTGTTSS
jgi:hypothetical protein